MTLSKKIQWFLIFSVLTIFSVSLVDNITGVSTQKVLADTISNDAGLKNSKKFVVVQNDSDASQGFLQRLSNFLGKDMLCAISEEQYAALSAQFQTSTDTLTVDGEPVSVVKVSGDGLQATQLKDLVSPSDVHCKVIKSNNIFYLLAGFQIS